MGWLPCYKRSWLRADLVAGLTIVALLVPEGMAYGQMAGVPPQTAFYAAPIGLLAFAEAIGPSRSFAAAHRYQISADQELIGLGAANRR